MTKYTNNDVIEAVKKSKSLANVLKLLNLKIAGGNYYTIKKKIVELEIDTSHFTGQLWSKNERLKDWTTYNKASNLKPHLINERGHVCERCQLSTWQNLPITLEIHHIDGIRTNNSIKNLQLLCPNCHSLTDNWRRKNNTNGLTYVKYYENIK